MHLDVNPRATRVHSPAAQFHLTCSQNRAVLDCAGELDIAEADRLTPIVLRLERLPTPVDVLMSDVRFVDSFGIEPLFASAHRRVAAGLPPMRITRLSNAVRRLMALLGISPDEPLDLTAWTAATRYAIAGQRG